MTQHVTPPSDSDSEIENSTYEYDGIPAEYDPMDVAHTLADAFDREVQSCPATSADATIDSSRDDGDGTQTMEVEFKSKSYGMYDDPGAEEFEELKEWVDALMEWVADTDPEVDV